MNRHLLVPLIAFGLIAFGLTDSSANPEGGQVAAGVASINTVPGTVTVNQSTNAAIINWQSFSINSGELTKFIQPSSMSATLNRVMGGQTSIINGTLQANGQIYLINGNGIVVGPGGVVNANSFTASTRDINDDDFLAGKLHFSGSNASGVQNLGTINALGGDVYLIGKTVDNEGAINATKGTVGLASADDVVLNLAGQNHVFVNPSATASSATTETAIHNSGSITAARAELKAANGNLFALAINNEGAIRATAVAHRGGRIFLTTDSGVIQNNGTITAKNGQNGGKVNITGGTVWNTKTIDVSGANGGSVAINSQNIQNDGTITAKGTSGKGGTVAAIFSGNALGATSGLIDASGATQGGAIRFEGTGATSEAYLSLAFDVSSVSGAGGEIQLNTNTLYLTGAQLNATGASQGGQVFLGKDDPSTTNPSLTSANTVYVSIGTSIAANATDNGNGGRITTYSTDSTTFLGSAEAKGGLNGGNGGLIEVSGEAATYFGGTANASSPTGGTPGTFLLDPKYITVEAPNADTFQFVDPDPGSNNQFGDYIINLSGNTVLISSPGDSLGGSDAGAVYLFNSTTGGLISTLRGSHPNDSIGSYIIESYTDSSAFVVAQTWNNNMGAVTFFNGTTGVNGVVSSSNSLVGATAGDHIGSGGVYQIYDNGSYNYLVTSSSFDNSAGAVTWGSGATGVSGVVSASNSLIGASAGDAIGSDGITELYNYSTGAYNYLVTSSSFDNSAGAVTWGNGVTGVSGVVSATNSLVGAAANDEIGSNGINVFYANGAYNYLVMSTNFDHNAGAVTWGNGTTGISGVVSASNSLVGAAANDEIGSGGIVTGGYSGSNYYALPSGNYLVMSPSFDGNAGAVTFGTGAAGVKGTVDFTNSLIGSSAGDNVGAYLGGGGITVLSNGNYVVDSPDFNSNMGAVTWGNGTTGISGAVGASNSLIGAAANDAIGSGGIVTYSYNSNSNTDYYIPSGNYLVLSPNFGSGQGAVTFGTGAAGVNGPVNTGNSLIGSVPSDNVGSGGVTILSNGNYVVDSPNFGSNLGAVTWGSGINGIAGPISATNSLIGTTPGDSIGNGGVTALSSGDYVVVSTGFQGDDGGEAGAGAVTVGDGGNGSTGQVSSANSLVGSNPGDAIGSDGITVLNNGNFVVLSPSWNGGMGAVTLGAPGETVSASNSVVGSMPGDQVGSGGVADLKNGFYAVLSPYWNGYQGAVTWVDASSGIAVNGGGSTPGGAVSASNSLIGDLGGDEAGSNGIWGVGENLFLVASPLWHDGTGAITFVSFAGTANFDFSGGYVGAVGSVNSSNSLVGSYTNDKVGSGTYTLGSGFSSFSSSSTVNEILSTSSGNLIIGTQGWNSGNGAFTYVNLSSHNNETGAIDDTNSLVGTSDATLSSLSQLVDLNNGNYAIASPGWNGGIGAVTWYDGNAGTTIGTIGSVASVTGSSPGDDVGIGGITVLSNGNYLFISPDWNSASGAVTLVEGDNGLAYGGGTAVSALNSLTGATFGDGVGAGGITLLTNGNYLVFSPNFQGDAGNLSNAGAVTWGNGAATSVGASLNGQVVTSANSLVGVSDNDNIGNYGVATLSNGNYLVRSPNFNGGAGAVTWGDGTMGISGVVSASNSLIGSVSTDGIGNDVQIINGTSNVVVIAPYWNGNVGAVTFIDGSTGLTGPITSANSLIGAAPGDYIGSYGISQVYGSSGYNYVVLSPSWNSSTGAATWGSGTAGITGVVGTSNSITGGSTNSGMAGYTTLTANNSLYVIHFASDKAHGGDGSVYAQSVNGPMLPMPVDPNMYIYSDDSSSSVTIDAASITAVLDNGTDVKMQANTDITINEDIITMASGAGGSLEFDAGRSILINANITTDNGNLTLLANDPAAIAGERDPGLGSIVQSESTIDVGTGTLMATIGGSTNGGDIAFDTVNAATVQASALNGNIILGGVITATTTSLSAGNSFINLAGANAITGQWNIYSNSPYGDSFGGLASNNFATFDATPTTPVGPGNNYLFAYTPNLSVVAISRVKPLGATIDYSSPQVGTDYDVLGFVNAASFGNVFTQDTAANTLTGVPLLSSAGASASAATGSYPIDLDPNDVALTRQGFTLSFPGTVNGAVPSIQVGSFFDDNSGNPISEEIAAFSVTGLNNHPIRKLLYVYDPAVENFVPVMVGATDGSAINQGGEKGRNIAYGSSSAFSPGPSRFVVPGNGVWNMFGGLVHSAPPPPFVVQGLQLNLNPTVYANMHQYVFGH